MNKPNLNQLLDETTNAIRNERLDDTTVQAAAARVQAKLLNEMTLQTTALAQTGVPMAEHIRNCEDFQSLIPAYLEGTLSSARTLLLEDHSRECVPCRKALKTARQGAPNGQVVAVNVAPASPVKKSGFGLPQFAGWQTAGMRYALAATLVIGFGLFAWPYVAQFFGNVGTLTAIVEAANGNVYRVAENKTEVLPQGAQLARGERLRTAKDAGAIVKLSDGSLIETRERSEFSVNQTPSGITINLERGNIIVQAAKQNGGVKLYVATPDSLVSVKGTTFAVTSGTKGSRISVVEGEVNVARAGQQSVLHPGQQTVTHASIAPVPVKDDIAWSRDAKRYQETLAAIKRDIDAQVVMPGNRFSTRLLDLMPANTVFYAAIPNLTQTLTQANSLLQQHIQANPELREWYESDANQGDDSQGNDNQPNHKRDLHEVLAKVATFGEFLGQEIAIGANGESIIALAELSNPTGFKQTLDAELAQLKPAARAHLNVVTDPLTAPGLGKTDATNNQLTLWLNNDLLVVSNELTALQALATAQKNNAANRFAASAFHARLADVYREGAGFLIGADLEHIIHKELTGKPKANDEAAILNQLGVTDMQHFIAEMKDVNGTPQNRAVVTFDQRQQHGIAAWLAAPGPMGALQFISPEANVVGAFVVQNPTALYDELVNVLKTADAKALEHLTQVQAQTGVNLREDFAAKLGGEFAAAIDGPILPTPSWKVVVEVNNPAGLQQSLERTVTALNVEMAKHPESKGAQLVWDNAQSGDRTYYRLKVTQTTGAAVEVNYAFAYGFMIAAPNRALVENAIKYRESGHTLLQAAKFKAALPADKQANFSAMVYYNLASVLEPLSKRIGNGSNTTKNGHNPQEMLRKLAGEKAALGYAYSFGDRMVFSLNTEDGALALTPSSLLGNAGGAGPLGILGSILH